MRKFSAVVIALLLGGAWAAKGGDIWLHMLSSGTPFSGTYYVGDSVGHGSDWWLQFELGWHTWHQSDAGIGPDTTDDGDWTWVSAFWYQDGFGNDRRVQGNIGSFRFSSAGNWYVNGRVKEDSWDPWHYANNTTWANSESFNPEYYFTVLNLNNPGNQNATAISGSQINLSWSADAQGHWVMIVRSTDATFTAPTPGVGYNVNDTIGGDTVVYKGGGTSMSDTGLNGGTTYYYRFYSENWSYYSTGVDANTTTPRPTDSIWDGGGGNNNFKTEANWNNDVYPDQGDTTKLTFTGTTRLTPNNDWEPGSTFNEIFFEPGAGAFTVGGNAFNLKTKIVNNDDSLQTINNDLTFPSPEVELNAASGGLTLNGTIANGGFRVTSSGANTLTLGGVVSGTGDILMNGSGMLVLNAVNTFNPGNGNAAYLVNGTTRVNNNNGLGVGTVYIGETFGSNPSTLQIGSGGVTLGNSLMVRTGSSGVKTIGNASAGAAVFSGNVTLEQNVTLSNNGGGSLTLSGAMSLNGSQKFITLNSGHTALISGAIGTDDSGGLVKKGDGTLQLGGANTFSGLYIDRGTIDLTGGSLAAGSTIDIGTTGGDGGSAASLKVSANSYTLDRNIVVQSAAGARTLETAHTANTLTFTGTLTLNKSLAVSIGNGSSAVDAEFAGVISGSGGITKSGAGTLSLSAANTYSGDTTISSGTLRLAGANDRINDDSLVHVVAGATFDLNDFFDKVKGLTGEGNVTLGSGSGDRLRVGSDNANRTFAGSIAGAGNVVKDGFGAWTLTGNNSLNGNTIVSAGTLIANGTSANSAHIVESGAFLHGAGTIGALTIAGTASAGSASNTVGELTVGSVNLESNGRLQVNITAMSGAAGVDWDVLTVGGGAGTYTVNAVNGSEFIIALKGNPSFDSQQNYSLVILNAGTASGFSTDKFTINTSEFSPDLGGGVFTVGNSGGDLLLIFTPSGVPDVPVAVSATSIDHLTFTANWNAAAGASSYRLDVAYDSGFVSTVSGYDNLTVNGTSESVTVPYVGVFYYRVRAVSSGGTSDHSNTITVGTKQAQGRNGAFGSTPPASVYYTPATIYIGDTATFGLHTWGDIENNWAKWRVVIDTDATLRTGGQYGDWTADFSNSEYKENASPRFTSVGTWYWGMQIDYGANYGTNFWMVRDSPDWADLFYHGTNANLTVTVLALSNPSDVSAVKDGTLPGEQINLSWTKWNDRDVMIVRSTGAIGTPTPGTVYSTGQSIPGGGTVIYKGGGDSVSDTGLSGSTTYNYKFYSENFGYYSAGTAISETTEGAAPGTPAVFAATAIGTTSFQANWGSVDGATSYRLDVSTGNSFASFVSGHENVTVNALNKNVTGLTAGGTYYYRVRAVNDAGTSANSDTISVTLPASSTVNIVEIAPTAPTSGELNWSATVGALYDVYYNDVDPDNAGAWTLIQQVQAANATETLAVTENAKRFYRVVIAGASPSTSLSPVWAVIKPTVPTGYSLMSAPLDLPDLSFNGDFGAALGDVLTGSNMGTADKVMIRESNGSWRTIYLNGSGVWYEGMSPSTYTLSAGQGYYIYRSGAPVTPRFDGPVGNTGSASLPIHTGWNIFGPSQGKNRTFNQVVSSFTGTPTAGWSDSTADLIVIDEGNGNWRRIMRYAGGSPTWLDLKTFSSPSITITPGQAVYYFRHSGGALSVNF